jgi:hypothetical protein
MIEIAGVFIEIEGVFLLKLKGFSSYLFKEEA